MEKEWLVYEEAAQLLGITLCGLEHLITRKQLSSVSWREVPADQIGYKTNGRIKRRYICRAALAQFGRNRLASPFYTPPDHYLVQDIAYLASAIDCEGCIRLCRRKQYNVRAIAPTYTPLIIVCNTDRRLTDWIETTFGGSSRCRRPERHARRAIYDWTAASNKAYEILRIVRPYMKVKDAQADLILAFYDEMPNAGSRQPLSLSEIARRELIKQKIHHLNYRGPVR